MFKKLSATILFLAMTFVIVAEQPALEYCVCNKSFHLVSDECCTVTKKQESCCENCANTLSEEIDSPANENRCDACIIPIVIDVGDYCWFTSTEAPDHNQPILVELFNSALVPPRGSPQIPREQIAPPDQPPKLIPLFLGNMSLRL